MMKFLEQNVLPWIAAAILRTLCATFRVEIVDPEGLLSRQEREPLLFAFWHNRCLVMGLLYRFYFPKRRGIAMISRSRDGEMIARVLHQFGIESARGSSSRKGNIAALAIIRKVAEGYDVALTPDGPRGPRYVVQPGIVHIAQHTGASILPVTFHLSHRKVLKSWDLFQIPYPFTKCQIVFSSPIPVPPEITKEEVEAYCKKIAQVLGE